MRAILRGRRSIGEVRVSLFVAGAVFGEIWNDSQSAKCCTGVVLCSTEYSGVALCSTE